jgi:GNAT superfamily N-acetyltransferase
MNILFTEGYDAQDFNWVVPALQAEYFGANRTRDDIMITARACHCFGVRDQDSNRQIAYARALSDECEFSWIADVVVDRSVRLMGVGTFLMREILRHPLIRPTVATLSTKDAHGFYRRMRFTESLVLCRSKG